MIEIRCSDIDNCRNRPDLYGKLIALQQMLNGKRNGNYSSGMCSKWRSAALAVHHGADIAAIRSNLDITLSTFISKTCIEKRQQYIDSFTDYFQQLKNSGAQLVHGTRQISWEGLHSHVKLTGQTPWILEYNGGYQCHYITEKPYPGWQYQLKYPLLQQYIATHILECNPEQVSVGIYAVLDKQFILLKENKTALKEHLEEAGNIFEEVHKAFQQQLNS